ncbi:MAG TPA: GNAT family N-acetyltransferase [Solirubrobacteraceae bacterium]|nr:GNAT family N-acetyltransferase [Solirubrobacteraceae bacterium]
MLELRPIHPDEVTAHTDATARAFYDELHPEARALWAAECEPERTLDAFEDGEIVATSGLLTRELTVPGGVVGMAGVTSVGVRPDHRRQGLLGRMMHGHLEAIHARGAEAVAALWASEATIYGRYGFDIAARCADLTVRSPDARLDARGLPRPRIAPAGDARGQLAAIHDAVRPTRPGMLGRSPTEWNQRLRDLEHERAARSRLQAALLDDGYAVYAVRRAQTDDGLSDSVVELRELIARTTEAHAALWAFLVGLELTRSVVWEGAPVDEPIVHRLGNPRAASLTVFDAIWVRLVDVARALAQRTYWAPVDAVLEVADAVLPDNAGRLRLTGDEHGARCVPTADAADLALDVRDLGAVYLGGTPLGSLAAAGRVRELTPGALASADRAFRAAGEPWCPEVF